MNSNQELTTQDKLNICMNAFNQLLMTNPICSVQGCNLATTINAYLQGAIDDLDNKKPQEQEQKP